MRNTPSVFLSIAVAAAFLVSVGQAEAQNRRQMAQSSPAKNEVETIRGGVKVITDKAMKCEGAHDSEPFRIVSDTPDALPPLVKVSSAIINSSPSIYCKKTKKYYTVPVVTSGGAQTGKEYLYYHTGQQKLVFDKAYLKPADLDFLKNDPGLPLARVAPEFINISSGQYEKENYRYSNDNHWQAMAIEFAEKDVKQCPDVVGKTSSYKLTRTVTDEYGSDQTEQVFTFDADWEKYMVQIIENGNHNAGKLGTMSAALIREYGCKSEEIGRMRKAFEQLFDRMDGKQKG